MAASDVRRSREVDLGRTGRGGNTGSGFSAGEERVALERMRAHWCMPPALCKRVDGAWTRLARVGSAGDRSAAKEGSDACFALVDWCSS